MLPTLIVLEGIDGSGKTTQLHLLKEYLSKKGVPFAVFDFPQYGRTIGGDLVGATLDGKFGHPATISPYLTSLPYAIDRFQASVDIKDALSQRKIVICNRYVGSNLAHQTGKLDKGREEFIKWAMRLEYDIFKIPREDLTIFLNTPPETARELVDKKDKREYTEKKRDLHEDDLNHLNNAGDVFRYLADVLPWWRRIDCVDETGKMLPPKEIHKKIVDIFIKESIV